MPRSSASLCPHLLTSSRGTCNTQILCCASSVSRSGSPRVVPTPSTSIEILAPLTTCTRVSALSRMRIHPSCPLKHLAEAAGSSYVTSRHAAHIHVSTSMKLLVENGTRAALSLSHNSMVPCAGLPTLHISFGNVPPETAVL